MWGDHDGMGWWMIFAGLWMLLFWAVIIGGVAWLIVRATGSTDEDSRPDTALEIARKRYASGEISREEFQQLSEELKRS